ncbi:MAG: hypothetical protein ACRC6E_12035 [Fusobacteriaceae bacterium]
MKIEDFKVEDLRRLNIGSLEGESDSKLNDRTFIITNSVEKILVDSKYNYVVAPFGGGKSAFFKALADKYISIDPRVNKFFENKSIISLNNAFNFDAEIFKQEEQDIKFISVGWALYILQCLIKDIMNNYCNKNGYNEFLAQISDYGEFKDKFDLHSIGDWISINNIKPKITISGIPITLNLGFKSPRKIKEVNLNDLYGVVNDFYKENSINAWITIDRVDDFVRHENYEARKLYIQGLHELIEELRFNSNIRPLLFMREDLFEEIKFSIGPMKVKDRTIYLKWEDEEILNFLFFRFIQQQPFKKYISYFKEVIRKNEQDSISKFSRIKKFLKEKAKKILKKEIRVDKSYAHSVVKEMLYLILPPEVEIENKKKEFEIFLKENLIDTNGLNPRIIIKFINTLNEKQNDYYKSNLPEITNRKAGKPKKINEFMSLNIYTNGCIKEALNITKADILEHIKSLFPDENIEFIKAFEIIQNEKKEVFKKYELEKKLSDKFTKEEVVFILNFLKTIGFFCEEGKNLKISKLYRKHKN